MLPFEDEIVDRWGRAWGILDLRFCDGERKNYLLGAAELMRRFEVGGLSSQLVVDDCARGWGDGLILHP